MRIPRDYVLNYRRSRSFVMRISIILRFRSLSINIGVSHYIIFTIKPFSLKHGSQFSKTFTQSVYFLGITLFSLLPANVLSTNFRNTLTHPRKKFLTNWGLLVKISFEIFLNNQICVSEGHFFWVLGLSAKHFFFYQCE